MTRVSKVLSACERTECRSELLHDLLNGDASRHFPHHRAINVLANGHSRHDPSRQVLCYILRQALGIIRYPGTYDTKMNRDALLGISEGDLLFAVEDAKRIYTFGQRQMRAVWEEPTITLKRGMRDLEANAANYLLEKLDTGTVPLYLSTFTFFNYESGAFSAPLVAQLPCPIEWIWASQYTLKDLDTVGSCEEFIVTCLNPSGFVELPRDAFKYHDCAAREISPLKVTGINHYSGDVDERRRIIGHALAELCFEGIEPSSSERFGLEYEAGRWERKVRSWHQKLIRFGRFLDRQLSTPLFQSKAHLRRRFD